MKNSCKLIIVTLCMFATGSIAVDTIINIHNNGKINDSITVYSNKTSCDAYPPSSGTEEVKVNETKQFTFKDQSSAISRNDYLKRIGNTSCKNLDTITTYKIKDPSSTTKGSKFYIYDDNFYAWNDPLFLPADPQIMELNK